MSPRFSKISDFEDNPRPGRYSYRRMVDQKDNPYNVLYISVGPCGSHALREIVAGIRNYYVLEGSGTFTVAGEEKVVTKNVLIRINPGETYSYEAGDGGMLLLEFNLDTGDGIAHKDIE